MKRTSLILASAVALLLATVAPAAAMPTEGLVNDSCSVRSNKVAGQKVTATVSGKNVARSQMRFAECKVVKRVLRAVINRGLEEPAVIQGYRITPTVLNTKTQTVRYRGLLRGADTATEITLKFRITFADN